jgi:ubiquitin-conjugating enzyme E2 Z
MNMSMQTKGNKKVIKRDEEYCSAISLLRIKKDIGELIKLNRDFIETGIYSHFNEEDEVNGLFQFVAMIIGNEGTPYAGCFYLFDVEIPKIYPMSPPKVNMITMNDQFKFNPNIYENGKVCMSILNTWKGPSWTACHTLKTVLLSIRAMILVENPLINEPLLFIEESKRKSDTNIKNKYNELVRYYSIDSVIRYIKSEKEVCKDMEKHMMITFNKYYEQYIGYLKEKCIDNGGMKRIILDAEGFTYDVELNYQSLLDKVVGFRP